MNALASIVQNGGMLRRLAGSDDGMWTVERLRLLTKHPNWSIATDLMVATRSYDIGVSFAASVLSNSALLSSKLTESETDRIQHIASTFLLEMLDKADMWEQYLAWFWFLRHNTDNYLRYDLHILSHQGNEIDAFVDDKGDEYKWVHNTYIYNHRRLTVERKLERAKAQGHIGSDHHHPQAELSSEDLKMRMFKVLAYHEMKADAEAFWRSFWTCHKGETPMGVH